MHSELLAKAQEILHFRRELAQKHVEPLHVPYCVSDVCAQIAQVEGDVPERDGFAVAQTLIAPFPGHEIEIRHVYVPLDTKRDRDGNAALWQHVVDRALNPVKQQIGQPGDQTAARVQRHYIIDEVGKTAFGVGQRVY
jgi:copper chaperone CopZ